MFCEIAEHQGYGVNERRVSKTIGVDAAMLFEKGKGYIFVSYHKPYPILKQDFLVPMHAGRACTADKKDAAFRREDHAWLVSNTIGDDSGDNISAKNHEYCECTSLYWAWKNTDFSGFAYVGAMQYRRQFILSDVFDKAAEDEEKRVYRCLHFAKDEPELCAQIGLNDEAIRGLLETCDVILPYPSDLAAMGVTNIYDDWVSRIEGVHVDDLVRLEQEMRQMHPDCAAEFESYLNGPEKLMYQMFIAKPQVMADYCEWLFGILFAIEPKLDTHLYTINGKRTLGYLAEILYGFYFTQLEKQGKIKVKHCGVTYLE